MTLTDRRIVPSFLAAKVLDGQGFRHRSSKASRRGTLTGSLPV